MNLKEAAIKAQEKRTLPKPYPTIISLRHFEADQKQVALPALPTPATQELENQSKKFLQPHKEVKFLSYIQDARLKKLIRIISSMA